MSHDEKLPNVTHISLDRSPSKQQTLLYRASLGHVVRAVYLCTQTIAKWLSKPMCPFTPLPVTSDSFFSETSSFKISSLQISEQCKCVGRLWRGRNSQEQRGKLASVALALCSCLDTRFIQTHLPLWAAGSLCLNRRHGAKIALRFLPTLTFCSLDMKK